MGLSVIIPSRNVDNLIRCIAAVRENDPCLPFIIIDDGLDHSRIPQDWCRWGTRFITGHKPFIYARACNQGIRVAAEDNLILLNDDALLMTLHGFTKLQQQWQEHPEYGLIGSSLNVCGTPNQHRWTKDALREEPHQLVFACVFIPRSTIDRVGLLDEDFAVNAGGPGPRGYGLEDDDYSFRVRQAGLKLGVYDSCFVDHTALKSTFRDDPEHPWDVKIHERLFHQKHGIWPPGHGYPEESTK